MKFKLSTRLLFYCEDEQTLTRVAQIGYESPPMEIFKTQPDTVLGNGSRWPCLSRGIGLGDLKMSLQTSTILWFHDSKPVCSCCLNSACTCPVFPCTSASNNLRVPLLPGVLAVLPSGVLGAQSTLLHPVHGISKVCNFLFCLCAEVLHYWQASEARSVRSQTQSVALRFQKQELLC